MTDIQIKLSRLLYKYEGREITALELFNEIEILFSQPKDEEKQ